MLISAEDAGRIDGLSDGTRRNLIAAGVYPRPVQLTFRRIAFVEAEVRAWARERIARRDAGLPVDQDPIVQATRGHSRASISPQPIAA